MAKDLTSLDWSLVQAFLAVADTGSLSGAARETGLSQPTLGRHIRQIEEALGTVLFRRQPRGLALTEAGVAMLPAAQAMHEAAGRIALIAAGQDERLEGEVRITASDFVSHYVLPSILAELRALEPGISVDLVPSDATENLLFREADIAIRMYRPEQLDVITRHVGDIRLGLFAAKSYLSRRGTPQRLDQILEHDLVGYDHDDRIIRGMAALGWTVRREDFATRTDDQAANWQLVRAGCGIGFGQVVAAAGDDTVVRLFPEVPIPPLPIWLTAHEALRRTPRVRRVWDLLADRLGALD
jgi:DNA-binding transcriptional LysR family regulator